MTTLSLNQINNAVTIAVTRPWATRAARGTDRRGAAPAAEQGGTSCLRGSYVSVCWSALPCFGSRWRPQRPHLGLLGLEPRPSCTRGDRRRVGRRNVLGRPAGRLGAGQPTRRAGARTLPQSRRNARRDEGRCDRRDPRGAVRPRLPPGILPPQPQERRHGLQQGSAGDRRLRVVGPGEHVHFPL